MGVSFLVVDELTLEKSRDSRKYLRRKNVNYSTGLWRQVHLKIGTLDFHESRGLKKKPKVNLSTPKSDVHIPESGSRETNAQDLEKQKLMTQDNI